MLAVSGVNPRFAEVHDYTDVYSHVLREIEHFFSTYKDLEGKRTKLLGWKTAETARQVIMACHQRYLERLKSGEWAA